MCQIASVMSDNVYVRSENIGHIMSYMSEYIHVIDVSDYVAVVPWIHWRHMTHMTCSVSPCIIDCQMFLPNLRVGIIWSKVILLKEIQHTKKDVLRFEKKICWCDIKQSFAQDFDMASSVCEPCAPLHRRPTKPFNFNLYLWMKGTWLPPFACGSKPSYPAENHSLGRFRFGWLRWAMIQSQIIQTLMAPCTSWQIIAHHLGNLKHELQGNRIGNDPRIRQTEQQRLPASGCVRVWNFQQRGGHRKWGQSVVIECGSTW